MKQVVTFTQRNIEQNLGLVHGQDWEQLLMVHDEIEIACKPQHTETITQQAMLSFPQAQEFFGFRCPIEGDAKIGTTWADVH
jgi:DNA polymerase I-like protein with 3'-5' exonuclease and polymerase domains